MINNIKDLAKVIKLCRSTGVAVLKLGELELHLGQEPRKSKAAFGSANYGMEEANLKIPAPNLIDSGPDKIETPDELSEEDLLNWSAREHTN